MNLQDVVKSLSIKESATPERIEDRIHLDFPGSGLSFTASPNGRVTSIHFFAEGYQNFREFQGRLPQGISFASARPAVRSLLGQPSVSGDGVASRLGRVPAWDRFDQDTYSLHVQYGEGRVDMVTIMLPEATPM